MTDEFRPGSNGALSDSEGHGGASQSLDGSSSPPATAAVTDTPELSLGERIRAAREAKGMTRTALDTSARIGNGKTGRIEDRGEKIGPEGLARIADVLGVDLESAARPASSPPDGPREVRPRGGDAKPRRRFLGRNPKPEGPSDAAAPVRVRPTARRVTTAPLTETIISFASGGLDRVGQRPLAMFAGFTAPVAGEIVDEVIAGTVVDKLAQPLVRGSEKYQRLGALMAGYASIAWVSNVPEAEQQAYALFAWSMQILLPMQGKEMVKRAKEQEKMLAAWAEIEPEMVKMFGPDPIRGLWNTMFSGPAGPPPERAPAEDAGVPA